MVAVDAALLNLMAFLKDSELGLNDLAEHVEHRQYRDYFVEEAQVRRAFHQQLDRQLTALHGTQLPEAGTRRGFLHRFWINLRLELGAGDAAALSTAIGCEKEAVETYRLAIEKVPESDPLHLLLERQAKHVLRSLGIIEWWSMHRSNSDPLPNSEP